MVAVPGIGVRTAMSLISAMSALPGSKAPASEKRLNFLDILRAGHKDYCLSVKAIEYMEQHKLPLVLVKKLRLHVGEQYENEAAWQMCLDSLQIRSERHIRHCHRRGVTG